MCWCTFQPGTFAGWGYEGVKLHFHIHGCGAGWGYEGVKLHFHIHGCGAGMQTAGHAVGWSCVSIHTSTIRRSLPFAEHNILIKNSLADLKTTSVHATKKTKWKLLFNASALSRSIALSTGSTGKGVRTEACPSNPPAAKAQSTTPWCQGSARSQMTTRWMERCHTFPHLWLFYIATAVVAL